jgi:hypothetical protein
LTYQGWENILDGLDHGTTLYASEFNEMLPPNEDNNAQFDGWVACDMWQPNQATNTVFLTNPQY